MLGASTQHAVAFAEVMADFRMAICSLVGFSGFVLSFSHPVTSTM